MKVGKRTPLLLATLALASALGLAVCPAKVSAAQSARHVREPAARPVSDMDISDARKAAEDARKRADALKKTADTMAAQARAQGKNPENQEEAPITYVAIRKYREADEEARQKEATHRDLVARGGQAPNDLTRAGEAQRNPESQPKAAVSQTAPPSPSDEQAIGSSSGETRMSVLWILPAALVALAVLAGMCWWTRQLIKAAQGRTEGLIRVLSNRQDAKLQEFSAGLSVIRDLKDRVAAIQDDLLRLSHSVDGVRKEQLLQSRPASAPALHPDAAPAASEAHDDNVDGDAVVFPVRAANFLKLHGGTQQVVKPDPLRNLLVNDPNGRGQLLLLRDGGAHGGEHYVVPRIARFQASQDYYNYYEQFYDCDRPSAGEVWIVQPAVVNGADGGWRLTEKGLLEVKS